VIPVLAIVIGVIVCVNLGAWALAVRLADRHVHDWTIEFTPTSIFLSCHCGVISPGWRLFEPPPGCERRAIP
jgi:hypothetical protein